MSGMETWLTGLTMAQFAALVTLLAVGASLRQWLMHGNRVRWFNGTMGLALAATAVWIAIAGQPH